MYSTRKILIITSCTAKKLKDEAPAKYLYQGVLFKKIKKLADYNKLDFKILSAKYGLLDGNQIVKPYDKTVKCKEDILRLRKKVLPELKALENKYDLIVLIMGKKYREVIKPLYNNKYRMIYDSKGIGSLISKINSYSRKPFDTMLNDLELCSMY